MTRAEVWLWGRRIGAVVWDDARGYGVFEYDPAFLTSGIQLAPFTLPLRAGVFDFPALPRDTFKGLPGLLADSLPDKFGNLLIDRWLAQQGRSPGSMNPVERLCYTGTRGMGALEFQPARLSREAGAGTLDIEQLVNLAADVLAEREHLSGHLGPDHDDRALGEILKVGTSAGGARAKAVLAWNPVTGEFRSGQVDTRAGFEHWLLKFDGVSGNADKELADPLGFGRLEYACYLAALQAGVSMAPSRLYEEGGRAHFMTRRFDRTADGGKLHMLSLGALRHFDFNQPRAYAYEQALETIRLLGLGQAAIDEQVRRAFLNIVLRNQDDHVKNIAFLMNRRGQWSLSPAFDVVYAWNPDGAWTSQHQMSVNGKTTGFVLDDLLAFGRFADLKPARTRQILAQVCEAVGNWRQHAETAGVPDALAQGAQAGFRLNW
ncbi:type II toxin-antitoxin system HipA family toxin [Isoalcanivorax beigongshangi]|uniref:Type II toxin-antitoxin system HipA family toxin n=1 Tax=Isoalcanivorax beigongshangi TaxID=3238810 RepID=A0ABV4AFP9_9GAMM